MAGSEAQCQASSGEAMIASESKEALSCRESSLGVCIIFNARVRSGQSILEDWISDEAGLISQLRFMGDMPYRLTVLHGRQQSELPGNPPQFPWELPWQSLYPTFAGHPGSFNPWEPDVFIREINTRPGQAQKVPIHGDLWEEPMFAVDENRLPFSRWNNTDPMNIPWPQSLEGHRGLSLHSDEYVREVEAFKDEHGIYPKYLFVVVNEGHFSDYSFDPEEVASGRHSVAALGMDIHKEHRGAGEWYWDSDLRRWVYTHLTNRGAMQEAMRVVREKGVYTEVMEYGFYPDYASDRLHARKDRIFREMIFNLQRALSLHHPSGAPGSGSPRFAIPWPPPLEP